MDMVNRLAVKTIALCLLIISANSIAPGRDRNPVADLVIKNAKVITIDRDNPRAQAIAFRGETILAVTSNESAEKYIKRGVSKIIDARGRLVVPGFNDAHIHFGPIDPDYIDLRYITDSNIITTRVKEAVARAKPGELIRGGRWEHEMFTDRKWPTKELIDSVAPSNPVVLTRADGHSVLVNSYVIGNSQITKETPDPFGGEIQRDPVTGEPTGIFKEKAKGLLKYGAKPVRLTAKEQQQRQMRGWHAAFDLAARSGVTSIQIAGGSDFEVFQKFKDMGKLTLRAYIGGSLTGDKQKLRRYAQLKKKYPRDGNWIRFGYIRIHRWNAGFGYCPVFRTLSRCSRQNGPAHDGRRQVREDGGGPGQSRISDRHPRHRRQGQQLGAQCL